MSIDGLIVSSTAADAEAVETIKNHHAELAGALGSLVESVLVAAERGTEIDLAHAALVEFLTEELMPHAVAEEESLYPAAARTERARPLIESMIAMHRVIGSLVDQIRRDRSPVRVAAAAEALRVAFNAHLIDENDRIMPIVAADPGVSLATVTEGMHELLGGGGDCCGGHDHGCGGHDHGAHDHGAPAELHEHSIGGHVCQCEQDNADPVLDVREVPHSIRHATVFGAFDAVPAGGALILIAPHDPIPLLHQLHDRSGGRIAVDYEQRGPDAWRLRLTRI